MSSANIKNSEEDMDDNSSVSSRHSKKFLSKSTRAHSKEKIGTDLYLTDYTIPRMDSNLLANTLRMRLRKTLPFDLKDNKEAAFKLKRESVRDMIQLALLDKQYQSEMQRQQSILKSQENQLRKRQQFLQKRTELHKASNERIQAQIRARTEPTIILPKLEYGTYSAPPDVRTIKSDINKSELNLGFSPIPNENLEEIRNLENTIEAVRVSQYPGAFLEEINEIRQRKTRKGTSNREALDLLSDDTSSLKSKSHHHDFTLEDNKQVTFGVLYEYGRSNTIDLPQLGSANTSNKKSNSNLTSRQLSMQNSHKVTGAGIGWSVPTGATKSNMQKIRSGNISKDLHPVTTLMHRFGLTERQTQAHIPAPGEMEPAKILPRNVTQFLTPVEMANHVALFRKKQMRKSSKQEPTVKIDIGHGHSSKMSSNETPRSIRTDNGYSFSTGMSTNRSVTSQALD